MHLSGIAERLAAHFVHLRAQRLLLLGHLSLLPSQVQLLDAHAELGSAHADVDRAGNYAAGQLSHGLLADFVRLLFHRHDDAVGLRLHDLAVFLALFGAQLRNQRAEPGEGRGHAHPLVERSRRRGLGLRKPGLDGGPRVGKVLSVLPLLKQERGKLGFADVVLFGDAHHLLIGFSGVARHLRDVINLAHIPP